MTISMIMIINNMPLTPKSMPPTNDNHMQNLKPRPPQANAKREGKSLKRKLRTTVLARQHRLTPPTHTPWFRASFAQSGSRSTCSVWPKLPMEPLYGLLFTGMHLPFCYSYCMV